MFLDDVPVNYLAVFLAAIAYFIIGSIWYAPFFFGHRNKHHEDITPIVDTQPKQTVVELQPKHRFCLIGSYIGEFIISLIIAYVLTLFIQLSQADDLMEGITVALWVWIGFIATTHFSAVLWDRKTVKSFFIHSIFMLIGLIAMASVIMYLETY